MARPWRTVALAIPSRRRARARAIARCALRPLSARADRASRFPRAAAALRSRRPDAAVLLLAGRTDDRVPSARSNQSPLMSSWPRRRDGEREPPVVGNPVLQPQPRRTQQPTDTWSIVLAADFRANGFAAPQMHVADARDVHDLLARRHQVHFDSMPLRRIEGPVPEAADVEVGAQLPIQHPQHVAIERRRHAPRIVISGFDNAPLLSQISAEE